MKNINIEEQLKHTLGNRSIAPSADAWERLAHNRQQSKIGKKKFGFFFIAASLAFLLAGGGLFTILNTDTVITVPAVVNTNVKEEAIPADTVVLTQESVVAINNDEPATKHKTVTPALDNSTTSAPRTQAHALAIANTAGLTSNSTTATAQPIINPKAANANDMYAAQAAVLLEQSLNDIALQRQRATTTNDTALLKEVETEMDGYYRDKAMKFFSLKHKRIRFAVRDHQ